ncbi:MAG: adenylate/guanylate cyclase domain-containing protein, partial [bacterium]|nr:adenylate/guanylate cyclase domain-containing protein [bacterium]
EFISIIIFAHLVIEFFVHFVRIDTFASKIIRRIWEVFGIGCVIAVAAIPSLVLLRRFVFFGWGTSLALIMIYLVYIIIKGRRIPSISLVTTGFIGMLVLLINDLLVGFQYRWVKWEFSEKDYAFAFFGLMAAASIVTNMKQSREIIEKQKTEKKKLSRYFSPDVVDTILDGDITLGGEEKPIVTLFADIVGFTNFSEHKDAALVVGRLNELFTRVSQVIFKYEATLDKYIGDCVMAFWGAPRSSPLDAYHAVACAVEIQQVCDDIKKGLPANEKPFLLRIGINYGDAIAGNIGSRERMDYTVIGDAVNIASRIESTGIPGKVAISESVFNAAGGEKYIQYSETKEVSAKGKSQSLKIYIVDSILPREE